MGPPSFAAERLRASGNLPLMYVATRGGQTPLSTYRVRLHAKEYTVEAGRPLRAASNLAASERIAPGEILRVKQDDSEIIRCYRVLESFECVPVICEDPAK